MRGGSESRELDPCIHFADTAAGALGKFWKGHWREAIIFVCLVDLNNPIQCQNHTQFIELKKNWPDDINSILYQGTQYPDISHLSIPLSNPPPTFNPIGNHATGRWEEFYNEYAIRNMDQVQINYVIKLTR